jgi:aryl-phospho-beta-D-glucosidase BglC (GH1 family)
MIGINLSGAEFGGNAGTHNYNYHYATFSEMQFYQDRGVDLIRLPFIWERMQNSLDGPLNVNELNLLKGVLANAATLGMDVIIDLHNYGRYNGIPFGSAGGPTSAQFADFWQKLAIEVKDFGSLAGYGLMNEPHDMPTVDGWKNAAQTAVDAIRVVDMDNKVVVGGNNWSSAVTWQKDNANFIINDPASKIVYEAHQYFDRYSQGFYNGGYDAEGAYPTIGIDRLKPFVEWLAANNLQGMIGEFGIPSNDPRWTTVLKTTLDYMADNNLDGTAWGGGTWWPTNYPMYMGKPGGTDSAYLDVLETYFSPYLDNSAPTPTPTVPPNLTPPPAELAPTVSISHATVKEDAGTMAFTVTRTGSLNLASSVNYSTGDGTAKAGSDYTAAAGTLSFAAGEASKTISVNINNDTMVEPDETLTVNLSGGTNVIIGGAQGIGTITDNDVAPPPPAVPGTVITGNGKGNTLYGTASKDVIKGRGGNDVITGGAGADTITGGAGKDRFVFDSAANANGDKIIDFKSGQDKLDFAQTDANSLLYGDQAFKWLDSGAFTGAGSELREYLDSGRHYVAGDINGDRIADFVIDVAGTNDLGIMDFIL